MTYGLHILAKAYDMTKATMCVYSHSDHVLPHCKCVLQFCAKFPSINISDQEIDYQYPDTITSICFLHLSSDFSFYKTWQASIN